MDKRNLDWIKEVVECFPLFLNAIRDENGLVNYTEKYDLSKKDEKNSLIPSILFYKINLMLRNNLSDDRISELKKRIIVNKNSDGFIYDKLINRRAIFRDFLVDLVRQRRFVFNRPAYKLAMTRSGINSLLLMGEFDALKDFNFHSVIGNENITSIFRTLDITKPWASGSQINHLLFYLAASKSLKIINDVEYKRQLGYILNCTKNFFDFETCRWMHIRDSKINNAVNGHMKLLMGLSLNDYLSVINSPSTMIDDVLLQENRRDACEIFNGMYVLYTLRDSNHRRDECLEWINERIGELKKYYVDYGFSFFENSCQTHFYGSRICKSKKVPDLHGSHMILWTLGMALSFEGLDLINVLKS